MAIRSCFESSSTLTKLSELKKKKYGHWTISLGKTVHVEL